MDVVRKIDDLRKEFGWSVYQLAKESNLTQSTVANMFARHSTPSVATLEQICNAFNLTLAQFFDEDNLDFSEDEKMFITKYRKLDKKNKNYINKIINIMID